MIELDGIRFAHHGRPPVADGLDLRVPGGQVHLLEGPSGSGKSTLLRLATGLIPRVQGGRVAGEARLAGRRPHRIPPAELPRRVGWVPQDPEESFAARTVERELGQLARNLDLDDPRQATRSRLAELDAAHLRDRDVDELSGGEAARVALAAAGLGDPDALVLDEPTAQLDGPGRERAADWIRERARDGAAVLAAEHAPHPLQARAEAVHELGAGRAPAPDVGLPEPEGGRPTALLEAATRPFDGGPTVGPLDVRVEPGEVVCLAGPNGCGKTTALHLLAGLEEPDAGRALLLDEAPGSLDAAGLAARLGIAFQHPAWHITQDTVAEEVAYTADNLGRRVDARARLDRLGLSPYADEHPWDLSGGERQRLALAAASAHDPPVLLLDEPTRGLDPASLARLADLLAERVRAGHATLVASHHPWMRELAHRTERLGGPPT